MTGHDRGPGSYIPADRHQPHGKRPWCPDCDTNLHLVVESPAVMGRRYGSIAVAVRCRNCRQSRVLDTTAQHLAVLPVLTAQQED
jgi:hypothetical protein